jgi:cytochrome c peroxidase
MPSSKKGGNSNKNWRDPGLGGFLKSISDPTWEENLGKHKVPTLRNVDRRAPGIVKAYGHNCYFKILEAIVHFSVGYDLHPAGL